MVSRPAGGCLHNTRHLLFIRFLLRWRAAAVVLHFATAVRLPVHHQHVILPLGTNMKATSAPARSRCCKSYWLSGKKIRLRTSLDSPHETLWFEKICESSCWKVADPLRPRCRLSWFLSNHIRKGIQTEVVEAALGIAVRREAGDHCGVVGAK